MHLRKKIFKTAAMLLSASLIGLFAAAGYYSSRLPDSITANKGSRIEIAEYPEISCGSFGSRAIAVSDTFPSTHQVTLSLFGAIPVKNIEVHEEEAPILTAGGNPFGIKLLMDGVMVTKLGEVKDVSGANRCPASEAGIEVGDVIRSIDNTPVSSNSQLQEIISGSSGRTLKISLSRNGYEITAYLDPIYTQNDSCWKGGMWVRDSIAGIGTLTFINRETGEFAGLGHPICDSDTGETVPLSSGEAVPVEITEAVRGEAGIPGELKGAFTTSDSLGTLERNNSCGIFGILNKKSCSGLCAGGLEFPMGYRQEIKTGSAYILTTISGNNPKKYDIEIESIDYKGKDSTKNMIIRITDKELLKATGGIVQGMSGSPIIQDGKLIGAVTHVFIADPSKGYGIFAENMEKYLCG